MCCSNESASSPERQAADATSDLEGRVYAVKGMTCDHCAMSVTEEVEQVRGVEGIDVDLQSGRLGVRGEAFSDEDIRRAVDEAGYEVVGSR
jgi:copper chaperone CopZ